MPSSDAEVYEAHGSKELIVRVIAMILSHIEKKKKGKEESPAIDPACALPPHARLAFRLGTNTSPRGRYVTLLARARARAFPV